MKVSSDQSLLPCQGFGLIQRNDTELTAVGVDKADRAFPDPVVDAYLSGSSDDYILRANSK